MRKVELRHIEGCPNTPEAERLLSRLAAELGFEVERRCLTSEAEARRLGFAGSPAFVVDGEDLFSSSEGSVGLACRVYEGSSGFRGVPDEADLREALRIVHDGEAGRSGSEA